MVAHENAKLTIPSTCPPKLEQLISMCFRTEASTRPNFDEIVKYLDEIKSS